MGQTTNVGGACFTAVWDCRGQDAGCSMQSVFSFELAHHGCANVAGVDDLERVGSKHHVLHVAHILDKRAKGSQRIESVSC